MDSRFAQPRGGSQRGSCSGTGTGSGRRGENAGGGDRWGWRAGRPGRDTSGRSEGRAAGCDEAARGTPAAGRALVPQPRRAKQLSKASLKCRILGKKVPCRTSGFQEAGEETCPYPAPKWKAWDAVPELCTHRRSPRRGPEGRSGRQGAERGRCSCGVRCLCQVP